MVRDDSFLPTPIAVVGPTASGKSALGLALAHALDGEVVNVDSMQLYRGMDIGTAKLSVPEREGIVHHQLDVLEVTEPASVARYQAAAVADVEDIRRRGKTPILVGGSMLYVQSLVDDWRFPPTDANVRRRLEERLARIGVAALHAELAAVDPEAARIIEDRDPRRTVRALEVIELTGKPFAASQPLIDAPARWGTVIFGLATSPAWLNPRIGQRTEKISAFRSRTAWIRRMAASPRLMMAMRRNIEASYPVSPRLLQAEGSAGNPGGTDCRGHTTGSGPGFNPIPKSCGESTITTEPRIHSESTETRGAGPLAAM